MAEDSVTPDIGRDASAAMIAAFEPRENDDWLRALRQIRGVATCPCTTTTPAVPSMGLWAGRPVANCALCYGVGAWVPFDAR